MRAWQLAAIIIAILVQGAAEHVPAGGTEPIQFDGDRLLLNFATSAASGIRIEIQNADGELLPGYSWADAVELIGNEIERETRWSHRADVGKLAQQPVRLRLVMQDADLYALRFSADDN